MLFRHQNTLSSVGDTAPESKVTCVTSHNLYDTAALMGGGSITHLIDRFHSCVYCCVKSDCVICTCDIQIDRSRDSDCIYSKVRKFLCSCERTVTTDNYQTVDAVFFTDRSRLLLSFLCTH